MGRLRNPIWSLVALILVAAFVVAAGGASGAVATPGAGTPSASPAATPGTPAAAKAVTIIIKDFAFVPANVTVKVGTTVTWINQGPTPHTTTAYDQQGKKIWDSNILLKGQKYSVTFKSPGSFDYLCTLHPFMKGHLTVVK